MQPPPKTTPPLIKKEIDLSLEQELAIELSCDLTNTFVGVTGGAGTGKTVVLGYVYKELSVSHSVVLCAPTGRAAKRITELTGIPAKTIHRLLEFPKADELMDDVPLEPKRNKFNRLEQTIVIVDEASMLAPTLFQQLVDALPRRGVIRFFGDNNQLPPVEEGEPPFINILRRYPSVELTYNFRSEDEIVSNAQRILRGSIPLRNNRFEIIYDNRPASLLLELVKNEGQFSNGQNQIITPARKGKVGTVVLNPSLQLRFNPIGEFLRLRRYDPNAAPLALRAGDKFLWTNNDYTIGIYNGEVGTVGWLDKESGELSLKADDRDIYIPPIVREYNPWYGHSIQRDPRKSIDLGYAITIHKAQGSEFDKVIICMGSSNGRMLVNRRSFYTAITRARDHVVVVTDRLGMRYAMMKREQQV